MKPFRIFLAALALVIIIAINGLIIFTAIHFLYITSEGFGVKSYSSILGMSFVFMGLIIIAFLINLLRSELPIIPMMYYGISYSNAEERINNFFLSLFYGTELRKAKIGNSYGELEIGQKLLSGSLKIPILPQLIRATPEAAVVWLDSAAKKGHCEAQRLLGECFLNGVGCAQDDNAAVYWLRRAARGGDKASFPLLVEHDHAWANSVGLKEDRYGHFKHDPTAAEYLDGISGFLEEEFPSPLENGVPTQQICEKLLTCTPMKIQNFQRNVDLSSDAIKQNVVNAYNSVNYLTGREMPIIFVAAITLSVVTFIGVIVYGLIFSPDSSAGVWLYIPGGIIIIGLASKVLIFKGSRMEREAVEKMRELADAMVQSNPILTASAGNNFADAPKLTTPTPDLDDAKVSANLDQSANSSAENNAELVLSIIALVVIIINIMYASGYIDDNSIRSFIGDNVVSDIVIFVSSLGKFVWDEMIIGTIRNISS